VVLTVPPPHPVCFFFPSRPSLFFLAPSTVPTFFPRSRRLIFALVARPLFALSFFFFNRRPEPDFIFSEHGPHSWLFPPPPNAYFSSFGRRRGISPPGFFVTPGLFCTPPPFYTAKFCSVLCSFQFSFFRPREVHFPLLRYRMNVFFSPL